MNRQSIFKAQKPQNSTSLPVSNILQRKTKNRIDYISATVDTQNRVEQQMDKPSLPGEGYHFGYDFSKIPVRINSHKRTQSKLKIGQPNDKYEQEADRVAEQVMRMPESEVQRYSENKIEGSKLKEESFAGQNTTPAQGQMTEVDGESKELQAKMAGSSMNAKVAKGQRSPAHELMHTLLQRHDRHVIPPNNIVYAEVRQRLSPTQRMVSRQTANQPQAGRPGQALPAQCAGARGNWIFLLRASGIGMGASYVRGGGTVGFLNLDTRVHRIRISPSSLVSSASFDVPAGTKMVVFVNRIRRLEGGSIIDSPGPGQTVHDIVVCP